MNGPDVVHVRDYGAVGDGVTDDTNAMQAALDSAADAVVLDLTEYRISRTLFMRRNGPRLVGVPTTGFPRRTDGPISL